MLEWILALSPAVKLAITLLSVVGLMRARLAMGVSLLLGGVVLALLFGMPIRAFSSAVIAGLFSTETVFLLIIVLGILTLSGILNGTNQIGRIIDAFRALVGTSRLTLVTFPALIGLLPMPGGAIFSAPMVKAAVAGSEISPACKAISNYWFRHIWEYWFPLYPGVILFLSLSNAPRGEYIVAQLPMTIWSLVIGYVLILHTTRLDGEHRSNYTAATMGRFLVELLPILIVVVAVAFLAPLAAPAAKALHGRLDLIKQIPIILGLGCATCWLFVYRGLKWRMIGGVIRKKNMLSMGCLVLGIMIFKSVMDRSGAVKLLSDECATSGIPLVAVISILPFAAGMLVGVAVGFVGTSFPLVLALLEVVPEDRRLPYYCLAYTMGYLGMMLSPLHTCLLLTTHYFESALWRVYLYLVPLCVSTGVVAVLLFLIHARG